jgi:cytochrome c553
MKPVLLLALMTACQPATADAPKPEPPPNERFERDMMVRFHMHQNFDLLRAIERLLLRGKIDEAKRFAEAIAMAPEEPAHGPWVAQVATVRERAMAVARAATVDDAIRRETRLAAACASCHRENYDSAVFGPPPKLPPDEPALDARMARHRWAADRLWEAVVGDADDAWQQGLDVLAAAPLDVGAERAPFARELQRLANNARRAKRPIADRAALYGDILVTCAGCHTKTR